MEEVYFAYQNDNCCRGTFGNAVLLFCLIKEYTSAGRKERWAHVGMGLLVLYIIRMLLNYFIQYYGHVMGVKMQAQMRSDMFEHLEKLPYSFYDNHETGKIMSRMTNDLMDISELAHHGPENLFISGIMVVWSLLNSLPMSVVLRLVIFWIR